MLNFRITIQIKMKLSLTINNKMFYNYYKFKIATLNNRIKNQCQNNQAKLN